MTASNLGALYIPIPGTELTAVVSALRAAFPSLGLQDAGNMVGKILDAYPGASKERGEPYTKGSNAGEWIASRIAQDTGIQANISTKGDGGAADSGPATGADGGEAYRDPFDPDFWTKQVELKNAEKGGLSAEDMPGNGQDAGVKNDDGKTEMAMNGQAPDEGEAPQKAAELKSDEKSAEELKAEIQKEIGGAAGKLAEGLLVTPTEGGLLVTISEQSDAPMFGLGSAVPEGTMVAAMEKIGKLLSERSKGAVAIRGHTDGRPFKSGN